MTGKAAVRSDATTPASGPDRASSPVPSRGGRWLPRSWRTQAALIGLFALAVRVGYVLACKHPVRIGGDAYYYHFGANLLVDGKGWIDPYRFANGVVAPAADHPPGTIAVLAFATLFGARTFFWHQLWSCLLGATTCVVIACVARRLAGRRAGIAAGLIAAVYPNLWFNDAMVMSETPVQLTTALAVLSAYWWWSRPSLRRAAVLGVTIAACALTRAEATLFVPLVVLPLMVFDRRLAGWRPRIVNGVVCAAVAGGLCVPWVAYNMSRFDERVTISTGFDPTAAVSYCDKVYYGDLTGYWWRECVLGVLAEEKAKNPDFESLPVPTQEVAYRKAAMTYLKSHEERTPTVVAARIGRTFGLFRPIQQIRLDTFETREYRGSAVGLGMYYALAVGTAIGAWLMRKRRIPISPIVGSVAVVLIATAITFGQTRYRASAEVVFVLGGSVALAFLLGRWRGPDPDPGPLQATEPVPSRRVAAGSAAAGPAAAVPKQHRTFPGFDGLRAIAALSVVIVHTSFPSSLTAQHHTISDYTARTEIGVAVFFLISGFLLYRPFVAAHIDGSPGPAIRPYLRRRIFRIVPAYWVALVFAAWIIHSVDVPVRSAKDVVIYFGFLQIYFSDHALHGIKAAWTLCVEMSFYAFLPLYAAAMARWCRRSSRGNRLRRELWALAGLVGLSTLWKAFVFSDDKRQTYSWGNWLPAHLDLFALGMLLAVASVWWHDHGSEPEVLSRRWAPAASWAAAAVCFVAVSNVGLPTTPVPLLGLGDAFAKQWLYAGFGFFLLLPAVFGPQDRGWIRRFLQSRPMVAIGLVSYGIYLWHEGWMVKILDWVQRPLFTMSFVKLTVATAALTAVSAVLSYYLVEQPFQRLGRGRPRPAETSAAPASPDAGGSGAPAPGVVVAGVGAPGADLPHGHGDG